MFMKKCEWVAKQTNEAKSGMVSLRDGLKIPVWLSYRCLYCGEYFNRKGAEEHFGETREARNVRLPVDGPQEIMIKEQANE